ncbi:major facilitator superfamily domain-containing protein [Rhodotorula diobovata]|uniref:Major facilitator superfamily domain-containing protein n=1 Tax=Rhodotorula diobovata TaxID=5288 RepID=A0A5C5FL71_9BASI|nr:major facilitator superfamily domain-containing protein [Rhodotorula diobovata]
MATAPAVELQVLGNASTQSVDGAVAPPSASSTSREQLAPRQEQPANAEPPEHKEAFSSYPDSGLLAWTQVAACFGLFFSTVGGVYSWGVFQDALVSADVASASTLAFVGSTQATMQAVLAIPISRLIAAYGPRRVALAGTACAGLGPILASFCTRSIPGLLITEGFLFGIGEAMCFFCAATLPSMYFLRRRNIATGIVYSGAGVGGAVLSIVAGALLQRMSLAWTFRAIGLIMTAINLPASLVLKSRVERQPLRGGGKRFDWGLFKDVNFVLLLVGTSIALFPVFVPPFFLPLYSTSIGLSSTAASMILAGFNLASAAGRIAFGLGADAFLGSINSLFICLFANGLSVFVMWPLAKSLAPLVAFAVVNGFCAGGTFSLIPGVLTSIFGSAQLAHVFSTILTFWTAGYLLGPPIAGFLLQAGGGISKGPEAALGAVMYAGALSIAASALVLAVRVIQSRQLWKKL